MTTKEFFNQALDGEVASKFTKVKSRDEVYELAKSMGLTDDKNTFIKEAKSYMNNMCDMSEEDIDNVAAAGRTITTLTTTTTVTAAATAAEI